MSKPTSGKSWLHECPYCQNKKCTFYQRDKENYAIYKCTKCNEKFYVVYFKVKNKYHEYWDSKVLTEEKFEEEN